MIALPYKIEGFEPMDTPPLVSVLPKRGKSEKPPYLEEAIFLDTETSNNYNEETGEGIGWIYQWAFHFAGKDCIGRCPDELLDELERAVKPSIDAAEGDAKCIVFVHNLSYDIQYLKDWLIARYPDFKILAVARHKFITFSCGPFEFRCTYKLSNRSLAKWGADLGIKHKKKSGLIDYHKRRYQDSELTYEDWLYMLYDIWALRDCVHKQLAIYGDDVSTVPLTSTAYIRRDARKNFRKDLKTNRPFFVRSRMTKEVYKALNGAMAGGITHGNRLFEDVTVECDEVYYKRPDALPRDEEILGIDHYDYRSEYPSEEAASDEIMGFPQSAFVPYYIYRGPENEQKDWIMLDGLSVHNCCLIELIVWDLEILPGISLPVASYSKFFEGRLPAGLGHCILDNGRILSMHGTEEQGARIFLTEWDLKWLRKQYRFEWTLKTVWIAPRGPIPKYLRDTIDENFLQKTVLKDRVKHLEDVEADEWEIINAKIDLMKKKNGLNGIYGMTATDPVRPEIELLPDGEWNVPIKDDEMIEKQLADYYRSYNNFMIYAFGVYTTALARNELLEAAEAIGWKYVLYVDTDSLFVLKNEWTAAKIEELNHWRNVRAEKIGAYVVKENGEKVYYDVLEKEKEHITSFRYIHAKAYAYITDGGTKKEKLHCTIAGISEYSPDYVPKKKIREIKKGDRTYTIWTRQKGISRVQELGSIDELHHNKKFKATGGTRCVYIEGAPRTEMVEGHEVKCSAAAIILEVEKTLSGPIAKDEIWTQWSIFEEFK